MNEWMTVWYAGRNETFHPAYQIVIYIQWQIPGVAKVQYFLLMMDT